MTERMDAAVDQFRNIERAVAAHVEHLRRAGETINSAGNSFGVASERLREAAEPVTTTLVSVEVSARHATDALRIATAANDSMREATVRLSEASRSASEVFNSYQSRFEGTDRALGTTIKGLVDGTSGNAFRCSTKPMCLTRDPVVISVLRCGSVCRQLWRVRRVYRVL